MISYRDKLERSVSLIPAAAALSAEDRAALVKSLETLVGQHSNTMESPELKKCIEALTEIQGQIKDLEKKFLEEKAALKAKQKRFQEKGCNFKLCTLKNNKVFAKLMRNQEEVLNYLKDVKCRRLGYSNGFKMEFIFYPNPHFENSVLTKTCHMSDDNKPILQNANGTKIKWYPMKARDYCFFNFFNPLQAENRIHRDYKIITIIRDDIIPQWHQMNEKKISSNSYNCGEDQELRKTMFLGERAVLEGKYQNLYEPLYNKRYEIVNGTTEVQETKIGTAVDQDGDKARKEKGVPYFWASAMKNVEVLAKITKGDERALKYLKDIKWCRINNSKGFKLEFFFDPNQYFKNTILTKAYHMSSDNPPMLEKTIGTNIIWCPGKRLTPSLMKRPRKRSKTAEFMTKQQSFFNFFNTPEYPGFPYDSSTYMHHNSFQKFEDQIKIQRDLDYEAGKTIRDKIIPHAVSLFTGEYIERGTDYEDLDSLIIIIIIINEDNYCSDDEDEEEAERL